MTPQQRAALIADVAAVIAQALSDEPTKRRWVGRAAQIREIASDDRIQSRANHTRRALIDEVMIRYHVSYSNAKRMISRAREYLREDKAR